MAKSSKAEVLNRVEEVLLLRLDGAQHHDIVRYASEKGWNVGTRQVENYIHRADQLLVVRQDRKRRRIIARHLAQRDSLYARAVSSADYRTALAILNDKAKLQDLYVSEKDYKELAEKVAELTASLKGRQNDRRTGEDADPGRKSGDDDGRED